MPPNRNPMQHSVFTLAASLLAVAATSAAAHGEPFATPVTKAIELLKDMSKTGEDEMHEEQKQYAAYKVFCDDTTEVKTKAIAQAEQQIEIFEAKIEMSSSKIAQLNEEIENHGSDVETWTQKKDTEESYYYYDKRNYAQWQKEARDWIEVVGHVINMLEGQLEDRDQNFSDHKVLHYPPHGEHTLLEAQKVGISTLLTKIAASDVVPVSDKRSLELFASQDEGLSAPAANAYEFQAGDIVATLKRLRVQFKAQLADADADFQHYGHGSDRVSQNLGHQIALANKEIEAKRKLKVRTESVKSEAEGDLTETRSRKEEDERYLGIHTSTCAQKAVDFDARQTLRKEELHTIEEAIAILESPTVAGAEAAHRVGLSAPAPAPAPDFLQVNRTLLAALRSKSETVDGLLKARDYLKQQAHRLESRLLSAVAAQVNGDDPLAKVKRMIEQAIIELEGDNASLTSQEDWCEEELARNEGIRDEKTEAVEDLEADADALAVDIAVLTKEIAELIKQVAGNREAKAEATEFRDKEKATNANVVREAKQAQFAVVHATELLKQRFSPAVLTQGDASEDAGIVLAQQRGDPVEKLQDWLDYGGAYPSAGRNRRGGDLQEAEEVEQDEDGRHGGGRRTPESMTPHPEAPDIFDSSYEGMKTTGQNVITLLEVIKSDFERLEVNTKTEEAEAQAEYDALMERLRTESTQMEAEIKGKSVEKGFKEKSMAHAQSDLKRTRSELDAAVAYYETLKPSCVDAGSTFELRAAARAAEIQSLKEALAILSPGRPE